MAFDSGMMAAVVHELRSKVLGARIEKIYQPEYDELIFCIKGIAGSERLMISAKADSSYVGFTELSISNPAVPPMFCMYLRKYLIGAKIAEIKQVSFERIAEIVFDSRDEMGYSAQKHMYIEIMGKYSNVIFCDDRRKILAALHIVDFLKSSKRQVMPGLLYELPPPQEKRDPFSIMQEEFFSLFSLAGSEQRSDRFLIQTFLGLSPLAAREIAFRASGKSDSSLHECAPDKLYAALIDFVDIIQKKQFVPYLLKDEQGISFEYSFFDVQQYGSVCSCERYSTFAEIFDLFFKEKEQNNRMKQYAGDILHMLGNTESRLMKKIELQKNEIEACADKEIDRVKGELLTANLHRIQKGMNKVEVVNYYSEQAETMIISLDTRLTPAQNAQRYYKKYTKSKTTEAELSKQISYATDELKYIRSVIDLLERADSEEDIKAIKEELMLTGYVTKKKDNKTTLKSAKAKLLEFTTTNGYRVLCGKNNTQNDMITFKMAEKNDWWFHVKNLHGSHVVMLNTQDQKEIPEIDFTEAASIAAYYSKARGASNVAVDYTYVRNIKKPPASKPGFVSYSSNWTAYVTPDPARISEMKR